MSATDEGCRVYRDLWIQRHIDQPTRSVGSLHWIMDMTFRDDECRLRTKHAPANFTTIRHMAHNLIRKAPGKDSSRLHRKLAAWGDDFLASLLTK